MSLEYIIELWKQHYVIGTIVGIIIVAFIYEVYMLPFRIRDYLEAKIDYMENDLYYSNKIQYLISCIALQQHSRFGTENAEEYQKEMISFNKRMKTINIDEEEGGN